MQKRVIFLNGPPGSGKDEVSNHLVAEHEFRSFKFAQPLRDAACSLFDIDESQIEIWKHKKIGKQYTGRDFLVGLSEGIIKPMLGEDWFGAKVAEDMIRIGRGSRFVVSDCGFKHEIFACLDRLLNVKDVDWQFSVWHLRRNGHDFKCDSRNWVYIKSVPTITIENDGDLESLYGKIDDLIFWNNQPTMGTIEK